jgi:hypothetical protein
MCDCITLTEEALVREDSNTKLGVSILISRSTGQSRTVVEIATYKRDPKKREKPLGMIPTYCPFCGEKYPESE